MINPRGCNFFQPHTKQLELYSAQTYYYISVSSVVGTIYIDKPDFLEYKKISVCTDEIDREQAKFENLGQVEVRDLCKIEASVADITQYRPTVIVFKKAGVSDEIIDMLPRLNIFYDSFVFKTLWNLKCIGFKENVLSQDEVVEQICKPVFVR